MGQSYCLNPERVGEGGGGRGGCEGAQWDPQAGGVKKFTKHSN